MGMGIPSINPNNSPFSQGLATGYNFMNNLRQRKLDEEYKRHSMALEDSRESRLAKLFPGEFEEQQNKLKKGRAEAALASMRANPEKMKAMIQAIVGGSSGGQAFSGLSSNSGAVNSLVQDNPVNTPFSMPSDAGTSSASGVGEETAGAGTIDINGNQLKLDKIRDIYKNLSKYKVSPNANERAMANMFEKKLPMLQKMAKETGEDPAGIMSSDVDYISDNDQPQLLASNQAMGEEPQAPTDYSAIANDPVKRSLVKAVTGVDFGSESAQQKREGELQKAREVEKYKSELAGDTELSKEFAKVTAKSYENAIDSSSALSGVVDDIDRLASTIEKSPNAERVVGPYNSWAAKVFGSPKDQALLGEIMSPSGDIVLKTAGTIKGAFTGRDQSLINSAKPNPSDPFFIFSGKLKAYGDIAKLTRDRADIYAKLLRQKVPPDEAAKIARAKTPFDKVEKEFKSSIEIASRRGELSRGKMPSFKSREDFHKFMDEITPRERAKLRGMVT